MVWAAVEGGVSDSAFRREWQIERACVAHMRKVRRHTHGRLERSDAAEERKVVSGSARRLQCRAHGGNSRRRMRAESDVSWLQAMV